MTLEEVVVAKLQQLPEEEHLKKTIQSGQPR
jgi:hypothetical protein